MSAFANCGRAVAHVRGSYVPIGDIFDRCNGYAVSSAGRLVSSPSHSGLLGTENPLADQLERTGNISSNLPDDGGHPQHQRQLDVSAMRNRKFPALAMQSRSRADRYSQQRFELAKLTCLFQRRLLLHAQRTMGCFR